MAAEDRDPLDVLDAPELPLVALGPDVTPADFAPQAHHVVASPADVTLIGPCCVSASPPAVPPKRPTLFDLESRYLEIVLTLDAVGSGYNLDEGSIDQLADELVTLDESVDRKVEGWTKWIRCVESDAAAAKAEADRLAERATAFKRLAERLRDTLRDVMIRLDKPKVKTALFTVTVKKSPPSVAAVSLPDLPTKFLKPPLPQEPDKKKILDEYRVTKIAPPGVTIRDDGKSLEIR
jgi:hypothetical protein